MDCFFSKKKKKKSNNLALAKQMSPKFERDLDPLSNIVVTVGASEGSIFFLFFFFQKYLKCN